MYIYLFIYKWTGATWKCISSPNVYCLLYGVPCEYLGLSRFILPIYMLQRIFGTRYSPESVRNITRYSLT